MTTQFSLDTFGDVSVDDRGVPVSQAQVIRDVVTQGVLADQVGEDAYGTRGDSARARHARLRGGREVAARVTQWRRGAAAWPWQCRRERP